MIDVYTYIIINIFTKNILIKKICMNKKLIIIVLTIIVRFMKQVV